MGGHPVPASSGSRAHSRPQLLWITGAYCGRRSSVLWRMARDAKRRRVTLGTRAAQASAQIRGMLRRDGPLVSDHLVFSAMSSTRHDPISWFGCAARFSFRPPTRSRVFHVEHRRRAVAGNPGGIGGGTTRYVPRGTAPDGKGERSWEQNRTWRQIQAFFTPTPDSSEPALITCSRSEDLRSSSHDTSRNRRGSLWRSRPEARCSTLDRAGACQVWS